MEYFEFIRTAFLVVGFLLAMSRDRATWMTVDLIATVVAGLGWVFFPQLLLGFQTEGDLTGIHLLMCRFFGIVMLAGAVKWYLNYQSHDSYTQVMLLATKIVGTSLLLITVLHSIFGPTTEVTDAKPTKGEPTKGEKGDKGPAEASKGVIFNDQWTSFGLTLVVAGLVGHFVWFLKAIHYGGHTSLDSRLNFHLRFDFFLTLLAGVIWLAYTPTLLNLRMGLTTPDAVQVQFGQSIGAILIGDAILSAVAPGFLFEEDKRNILMGRVVMNVGFILVTLHAIITYDEYQEKRPWASLIICAIWLGNTILGHYAPHETAAYGRKYKHDD